MLNGRKGQEEGGRATLGVALYLSRALRLGGAAGKVGDGVFQPIISMGLPYLDQMSLQVFIVFLDCVALYMVIEHMPRVIPHAMPCRSMYMGASVLLA